MLYILVFTNLSSLFFFLFFCSVWWHFMLKQWETPPSLPLSTICSSATNYFDGERPPLLQEVSWWYFSISRHMHTRIVWSSEQEKEHELVFDSHNWLGQMSTFSSLYPITLALIIQYSYVCVFKLVRPHVHVWCHCLYCRFFSLLLFAFYSSFSNSWWPSSHDNSITFLFSFVDPKLLYIPF